jgi:hypothetical protein
MSSKTRVSKQVKVTQGKQVIIFELQPKGLVISYGELHTEQQTVAVEATRFVLKTPGMDALRELLGLETPLKERFKRAVKDSAASREEIESRLTREPVAPDHPPVDEIEGLSKPPGEAEAGMD